MTSNDDQSKLDLEIIRGPLGDSDAHAVCCSYNRLAQNDVPHENFRRWLFDSPSGPAIHALLRASNGEVAAHVSIFPFPLMAFGKTVVGGKAEYLFVEPNYRKAVVRGYESSGQFPAIVLLKALYRHTREELKWDPVFISAPPDVDAIHRHCGAKSVAFALTECLFIRRPVQAARYTPNLTTVRRAVLFAVGVAHSILWRFYYLFTFFRTSCLFEESLDTVDLADDPVDSVAFSRAAGYLRWRYPADQFVFYRIGDSKDDFVIARRGSPTRYLRVCAARISSDGISGFRLLTDLLKEAAEQRAIGVRWAIYQNEVASSWLVAAFRRLGAVCAKRTRTLSILTQNKRCLDSASWIMEDSATSFEH